MYGHNSSTNKPVFRSFLIHILAWSLATPDWGFNDFPQPLQTVGRMIPQLACECFFPIPSRFILQYLFPIWHYTVRASYVITTWCTIKQSQNIPESQGWGFKLFVMTHIVALFWIMWLVPLSEGETLESSPSLRLLHRSLSAQFIK